MTHIYYFYFKGDLIEKKQFATENEASIYASGELAKKWGAWETDITYEVQVRVALV